MFSKDKNSKVLKDITAAKKIVEKEISVEKKLTKAAAFFGESFEVMSLANIQALNCGMIK